MKTEQLPGGKPLKIRNIKSALRLLGRVLYQAQRHEIDLNEARLIVYACSIYAGIVKDGVFEERLNKIETDLKNRKEDL